MVRDTDMSIRAVTSTWTLHEIDREISLGGEVVWKGRVMDARFGDAAREDIASKYEELAPWLEDRLSDGPLYIHCQHGSSRSVSIALLYAIRHQFDFETVIPYIELRRGSKKCPDEFIRSLTEVQRGYQPHWTPAAAEREGSRFTRGTLRVPPFRDLARFTSLNCLEGYAQLAVSPENATLSVHTPHPDLDTSTEWPRCAACPLVIAEEVSQAIEEEQGDNEGVAERRSGVEVEREIDEMVEAHGQQNLVESPEEVQFVKARQFIPPDDESTPPSTPFSLLSVPFPPLTISTPEPDIPPLSPPRFTPPTPTSPPAAASEPSADSSNGEEPAPEATTTSESSEGEGTNLVRADGLRRLREFYENLDFDSPEDSGEETPRERFLDLRRTARGMQERLVAVGEENRELSGNQRSATREQGAGEKAH